MSAPISIWRGSGPEGVALHLLVFISQNWRGKPLITHQVIVQLIAATTTKTGLTVRSEIDANSYPAGIKVADDELARVNLRCHEFHGDWNYTIHPSHVPRNSSTGPNLDSVIHEPIDLAQSVEKAFGRPSSRGVKRSGQAVELVLLACQLRSTMEAINMAGWGSGYVVDTAYVHGFCASAGVALILRRSHVAAR